MKRKEKLKKWLVTVLAIFYVTIAFPTAVVNAESGNTDQKVGTESIEDQEVATEVTTTIEDEPTAEAAIAQSQMTLITQMSIIGLGILMAGAGTYVFCIKNKSKE